MLPTTKRATHFLATLCVNLAGLMSWSTMLVSPARQAKLKKLIQHNGSAPSLSISLVSFIARELLLLSLESDSKLSQGFHGLARCLVTRRMCAMVIQAAALSMDFSQSFDRRRHRPSQVKVGSTTQRRGRTSKPLAASERLTVSTVQRPMAFKASRSFGPA